LPEEAGTKISDVGENTPSRWVKSGVTISPLSMVPEHRALRERRTRGEVA